LAFIEISYENYFHNLEVLSKKAGGKEKLSVVLKDNAYGHSLLIMAKLSSDFGIKRAVVRFSEEALKIEEFFEHIIILSPKKNENPNPKFSYVINDLNQIPLLSSKSSIHLKVDTGMHRNGIDIKDLKYACKLIKNLDGVMTHFRSADLLSSELFWQRKIWEDVKKEVLKLREIRPLFHSANSASLLRNSRCSDDFARCGISTYGYQSLPSSFKTPKLKPVLSLWAEKISTRSLDKGQRVGYGGEFEAKKKMIVSTYDIGYGDGFFRFDGDGELLTSEKKPFLGKISMDSCIVEGDKQKISLFKDASHIAKHFNTITYDVLTKLSASIPRVLTP
jgi:alanine racemase